MYLLVYQIGDLNFWDQLVSRETSGISLDMQNRWRVAAEDFTTISGQKLFSPLTRGISQPIQIKVSGEVIQTEWLGINEFISSVKSLGGRQGVPIITFRLEDSPNNATPEIDWLVAYGSISDVSVPVEYANNAPGLASIRCEVSMNLDTVWQRLSPWEWEYRAELTRIFSPADPWSSPMTVDTQFAQPYKMRHLIPGHYFYRWKLSQSDNNTAFWALKYSGEVSGGQGADYDVPTDYELYVDPRYWSAPPKSVYAFTEVEPDGVLSIAVTRQIGLFYQDVTVETSTLDVSVLSAEMETLGYGPLLVSDQIITGLVVPLPGYVLRDGEKLDVRPRWSYSGTYPGETGQRWNKVSVSAQDTPFKIAYLHDYGVL